MSRLSLRVIDAARELGVKIVQKGSHRKVKLRAKDVERRFVELHDALEDFDKRTGRTSGVTLTPDALRAELAEIVRAMNDAGLDVARELRDAADDTEMVSKAYQPAPKPRPATGPEIDQRPHERPTMDRSRQKMAWPKLVAQQLRARPLTGPALDLEVGDAPDASDVVDFDGAIDAMMDKLEYAVSRVGWTPKLAALAHAFRMAQAEAAFPSRKTIELTRSSWLRLGEAMEEALLQARPPAPAPVPKPSREPVPDAPEPPAPVPRHMRPWS